MFISREFTVPQISTGDILREEIRKGSSIGKEAGTLVANGHLVPDRIVITIVKSRLQSEDCVGGFILDGFPRTLGQAQALDSNRIEIDHALFLDVADPVILRRLNGRRVCASCNAMFHLVFNAPRKDGICDQCGHALVIRKDDEEETIRRRIGVYHEQTSPVIEYYQNHPAVCCHRIDAGSSDRDTPEVVAARIRKALHSEVCR